MCCCSGMIVFKLERERPAYATHAAVLYYIKDRYLRTYDYASQRDNPLISIRRPSNAGEAAGRQQGAAQGRTATTHSMQLQAVANSSGP